MYTCIYMSHGGSKILSSYYYLPRRDYEPPRVIIKKKTLLSSL